MVFIFAGQDSMLRVEVLAEIAGFAEYDGPSSMCLAAWASGDSLMDYGFGEAVGWVMEGTRSFEGNLYVPTWILSHCLYPSVVV